MMKLNMNKPTNTIDQISKSPKKTKIIAIVNQKGGVGKTTTAINLATALAAVQYNVLLVDFDPQGNASTGLNIRKTAQIKSIYDVIIGNATMSEIILPTLVPGLYIAPSSRDLAGAEIELVSIARRHFRLKDNIASLNGGERHYDYILIDCPPSLSLLTINAMAAANSVIIPLQCEFFAIEGLSQILQTINQIKQNINQELELQGIVLTMYDNRNNLSEQVSSDVRSHMNDKVYETTIPRNVRLSEASSFGKPALIYDFRCPGSMAYVHLAKEILEQENKVLAK